MANDFTHRGIFLEVGGLKEAQARQLREAVSHRYGSAMDMASLSLVCYGAVRDCWGVKAEGFFAASGLVAVLTNEDSGADYLT